MSGTRVWITGNIALVQSAGYTVLVNDNNNHAAGTVINGGVLQLGAGGVAGDITGNITNNAELAIKHSNDHALAGVVSGSGVISQKGAGVLTLNAANTHTGGVRVDSGTLAIAADGELGAGGALALNGGAARFDAPLTAARSLAVSSSGGRADLGGNDVTFTGTLAGDGTLEKTGAGALALAGATGFTGSLTVTAGALRLGSGPLSLAGAVLGSGAALEVAGGGALTLHALSGGGTLALGTGTLAVDTAAALDYAGTLAGAAGSAFVKTGPGSLALSGAAPSAAGLGADVSVATGALAITGGTLATTGSVTVAAGGTLGLVGGAGKIEAASVNFGAGAILNVAGLAAGAGSTVDLVRSATPITTFDNLTYYYNGALPAGDPGDYRTTGLVLADSDTVIRLTSVLAWNVPNNAHGTFNLAAGTADTISDVLADMTPVTVLDGWDGKTLLKTGSGGLTLAADNIYTGTTFISGGTLQLGAGGTTGSVSGAIVNDAVLAVSRSGSVVLANAVSGSGEIVQAGSGVLTLAGANTHASGVRVRSGTLAIAADAPLGASAAPLTLDGGDARFDAALDLARPVALASGGALDTNGRDITLSGAVTGTGNLRKTGAGALVLNGANTFTGTALIAQGSLRVGTAGAAAAFAQSAGVALADAAGVVFDVNNQSVTLRALSGGGTSGGDIALGASGTLAGAGSGEQAFHGKITGGADSAWGKTGPGALVLDTPLHHAGVTVIRNGVLRAGAADLLAAGAGLVMTGGALDTRGLDQTLPALSGGGGEFLMRVTLEAGAGDRLTLAGAATGDHFVTVENSGGGRSDYAQLLIATPVPEARAATFALTAPVSAGIYSYDLAQRDDGWYLQNLPVLSPAGQALLYTAGSIGMEWQYTLDSLRARLGDIRQELPLLKRKPNGNIWMSGGVRRVRADADLVGRGFNEDVFEIATGLDRVVARRDTSLMLVGLMLSTSRVDRHFTDNGDGGTTALGAGLYAAWLHDAGWFAGLMLKTDRLQNSLNAYGHPVGRTTAEYDTNTFTASLEAGKKINLSQTWWFEPSVQLASGRLGGAHYTAYDEPALYPEADRPYYDDDIRLDIADARASQYRAALRVGRSGPGKWRVSAWLAGVRTVSAGGEVVVNGDDFRHTPDYDGWRVEAGLGASCQLSRSSQFYIDYEYARAERYDRPWSLTFGCRRVW
jgi:outer membrane autotransporter protein